MLLRLIAKPEKKPRAGELSIFHIVRKFIVLHLNTSDMVVAQTIGGSPSLADRARTGSECPSKLEFRNSFWSSTQQELSLFGRPLHYWTYGRGSQIVYDGTRQIFLGIT